MTEGRTGLRIKVLALLVVFMFIALTTRLWFLQVLATERYRSEASQNAVRLVQIPAPRGRILDDNGVPLVDNQPSLQVVVDRGKVEGHEEEVLFALSDVLKGISVATLANRLDSKKYLPYAPVPVAFNVSKEVAFAIGEYPERFSGVTVEQVPARQYMYGDLAAHILGFIGPINDKQYGTPAYAGYGSNDVVGQAGLEQQYESYLRGQKGATKLRINSTGKVLGELGTITPPVSGADLRLTVDLGAQQLAEEALDNGIQRAQAAGYPAISGSVVVMDPGNGAIKAIASSPTFNPSVYNGGLSPEEMARLGLGARRDYKGPLKSEWQAAQIDRPLTDRAMDGLYPPGSTIKPFVALSALREGFATEEQNFPCPGTYHVPGDPDTPWNNWTTADLGYMNLRMAIIQSCDTVFYRMGYEYWHPYIWQGWPAPLPAGQSPKELLQRDFEAFGFGRPPGIDFPSASSGLVPDNAWKQATFGPLFNKNNSLLTCEWNWCPGDYINMSIGQGNMRVTPLQLARGFSVIATDGKLCEPQLAADAERPGGKVVQNFAPSCHQVANYTPQQFKYIRSALQGVPRPGGTAASAFVGFPFASPSLDYFGGKTGTAEMPNTDQTTAWFAAIAKGQDSKGGKRQYVVVAMIERAGHGSETAAPVVRQVVDGLFDLNDVAKLSLGTKVD